MAKTVTPFRLSDKTRGQIKLLAESENISEADVVAQAVAKMARQDKTVSKRIDIVYKTVSAQIQQLEIIRDYERELTSNEEALYNWLYKAWDELRKLPGFWEPRYLNPDGQLTSDPEWEKTRPQDM